MPARSCPKCGYILKSTDCYFCSNCGSKLEDSYIRPFNVAKITKYKAPEKRISRGLNRAVKGIGGAAANPSIRKNVFLSVVAALLAINVISLILLYIYPIDNFKKNPEVETKKEIPNALDLEIGAPVKRFRTAELGAYIPSESLVYIELTNYDYFVDSYFLLNTPYEENLKLSKDLMEGSFAVFALKLNNIWEAGAIFIPKDAAKLRESLDSLKASHLSFEVIEDYLVVATNPNVVEKVRNSQQKLALNITQTPRFVTANADLEREGVVKLILLDPHSKELAASASYFVPSLKPLMDQIINSGYEELIIL